MTCPSDMAYGSRGAGGVIPADATLIFEIKVIDCVGDESLPNDDHEEQHEDQEEQHDDH